MTSFTGWGHALRALREYALARFRFRRLRGEALQALQERAAVDIARYAMTHSPFWRRHFGALPAERWRELPAIDKATMMASFHEVNTRGVTAERALAVALKSEETRDFSTRVDGLTVVLSSGTSGHRGISLVDDAEIAGFVGFALARMLDGLPLWRRHRVAFFLRSNSNLYEATRSPLIDFRYFDLTLSRAQIARRLQELQPDILVGPPALLSIVAELVEHDGLVIAPSFILSGAEVLEPQVRARLETLFGVVVRDVYHTSEGPIAFSCRAGRLHLQEDVAIVELEPLGDGRFTPIVTQLHRRVQPLLRYRMNDVVVVDGVPCPCGSAFRTLQSVEGRCDDVVYLRRADGSLQHVFPDTLRRAVLETDGVDDYRIDQRGFADVVVAIAGDRADLDALRARLLAVLGDDVTSISLSITRGIAEEPDRRKKLVRVRRTFALSPAEERLVR